MTQQMKSELKSPADASAYLGLAPATLATWRSAKRGPAFVKLGGRVLYRVKDLDDFIDASVRQPQARA